MDLIAECKVLLEGQNLAEIQRRTGLAYMTIRKLSRGESDDIYVSTYQKIKEAVACDSENTKKI